MLFRLESSPCCTSSLSGYTRLSLFLALWPDQFWARVGHRLLRGADNREFNLETGMGGSLLPSLQPLCKGRLCCCPSPGLLEVTWLNRESPVDIFPKEGWAHLPGGSRSTIAQWLPGYSMQCRNLSISGQCGDLGGTARARGAMCS